MARNDDEEENTQQIKLRATGENLASSVNLGNNPNTSSITIIKPTNDEVFDVDAGDSAAHDPRNFDIQETEEPEAEPETNTVDEPINNGFGSGPQYTTPDLRPNITVGNEPAPKASLPPRSVGPTLANPRGGQTLNDSEADDFDDSTYETPQMPNADYADSNNLSDSSVDTGTDQHPEYALDEHPDYVSGDNYSDNSNVTNTSQQTTVTHTSQNPQSTVSFSDGNSTVTDSTAQQEAPIQSRPESAENLIQTQETYQVNREHLPPQEQNPEPGAYAPAPPVRDTAKMARLPQSSPRASTAPSFPATPEPRKPRRSDQAQKAINLVTIGNELVTGFGDPRSLGWLGRVVSKTTEQPTFAEDETVLYNYPLAMPKDNIEGISQRWKPETELRFNALDSDHLEVENRLVIFMPNIEATEEISSARSRLIFANILDSAIGSGIKPFIIGPQPSLDPSLNSIIAELNNGYADASSRRGIPYANTFSPLLSHAQWQKDLAANDGVPGQAGHGLIAWLVLHRGWFEWMGVDAPNI